LSHGPEALAHDPEGLREKQQKADPVEEGEEIGEEGWHGAIQTPGERTVRLSASSLV
jgi:hypothetical protein